MRQLLFSSRLLAITLTAFTLTTGCQQSPKKAQTDGSCKVNADCASNLCVQNKCSTQIDCNLDGNELLPKCKALTCNDPTDDSKVCPSKYYCSGKTCVFGTKPKCTSSADCAAPASICSRDSAAPENNRCVECQNTSDCKMGQTCSKANKCTTVVKQCSKAADCTASMQVCSNEATNKICVACNVPADCTGTGGPFTCADHKCEPIGEIKCTKESDCSGGTPLCDTTAGKCVACDAAGVMCKDGTTCDTTAGSPTKGQCVSTGGCNANGDCTAGVPQGAPNGSSFFCNKQTRQCGSCSNDSDCVENNGGTCSTVSGLVKYCRAPDNTTDCTPGQSDCASTEACNGGKCGTVCDPSAAVNQCQDGNICIKLDGQAGGSCQMPETCTNTADCGTGGYNGLACVASQCRHCDPAAPANDCANAPNNRTVCDPSSRLCAPTAPTNLLPLGATCNFNSDCDSGTCHQFNRASGGSYAKLCVSVCSRTETTGPSALKDCPTTVAANINTLRTGTDLAVLSTNKGFRCTLLDWPGVGFTSTRVCLHSDDFHKARGESPAAAGAQTVAGGVVPAAGDASKCQADFTSGPSGAQSCAYRCGESALDCPAGYSCNELPAQEPGNPAHKVSSGTLACQQRPAPLRDAGESCNSADLCKEGMCDGQCVREDLPRLDAQDNQVTCNSGTCPNSADNCRGGLCYRKTKRDRLCDVDAQCEGGDRCFLGSCYDRGAVTGELCQDRNGCSDSVNQFCGGTCAKHCNQADGCSDQTVNTVCGFRPSAPNNSTSDVGGNVWSRVCRKPTDGHGVLAIGATCDADVKCASELCVSGKCVDLCGFANKCPVGKKCTVVTHQGHPQSSATFPIPVCL